MIVFHRISAIAALTKADTARFSIRIKSPETGFSISYFTIEARSASTVIQHGHMNMKKMVLIILPSKLFYAKILNNNLENSTN